MNTAMYFSVSLKVSDEVGETGGIKLCHAVGYILCEKCVILL